MARRWHPSVTLRVTATVVAVVAAVCVLLTALTTAAVRSTLTDRLDADLASAHARTVGALQRGIPVRPPESPRPDPPEIREARGQVAGTITAYLTDDAGQGQRIDDDGSVTALTAAELAQVSAAVTDLDDVPSTMTLDAGGDHRVLATGWGAITVVTALPTAPVDETVASLVRWGWLSAGVATLLAGGAAALVVRRQLRPLRQVAATAHAVTETDLTDGAVEVPRVPGHLIGLDDEVGQVAGALDAVLGHVDDALAARHRSEQQVRQFVADASHELRTPLATVRGYTDLALRSDADDEIRTRALEKVQVEAGRMGALVEDLLLLARLDQGRPLERADVDVTHLVLESVGDARVTAPEHRWRLDLPDEPVTASGDAARLHQVLSNLLANAARHTPEGTTVTTSVRLVPAADGNVVELSVTDDGPGIAPELLPGVFARFTRGDSARTRASSGAGLGLALARSIARAHGGELTVDSVPGRTRFTVTLPAS